MPVWLLADGLTKDDAAQIDLRASGRSMPHTKLGSVLTSPFQAKALLRLQPDIGLVSCFFPAQGVDLPLQRLLGSSGGILLRPSSGLATIERDGKFALVAAREAIFLAKGKPVSLRLNDVARLDCFIVADHDCTPEMAASSSALRIFPHGNDTLTLLGNYGAALLRGLMPVNTATLRTHSIKFMTDLLAIMCRETEMEHLPPSLDRPTSRLNAIQSDIEARLEEHDLTAGQIAKVHGISTRYLQKLFEAEGLTFSEFVLKRRLDRAMRILQSVDEGEKAISQIAFGVGFGDLSYFNRTFRKRFGMSPRLARAKHQSFFQAAEGGKPAE